MITRLPSPPFRLQSDPLNKQLVGNLSISGMAPVIPRKPDSDPRTYRVFELPNKLQVVLCSGEFGSLNIHGRWNSIYTFVNELGRQRNQHVWVMVTEMSVRTSTCTASTGPRTWRSWCTPLPPLLQFSAQTPDLMKDSCLRPTRAVHRPTVLDP